MLSAENIQKHTLFRIPERGSALKFKVLSKQFIYLFLKWESTCMFKILKIPCFFNPP